MEELDCLPFDEENPSNKKKKNNLERDWRKRFKNKETLRVAGKSANGLYHRGILTILQPGVEFYPVLDFFERCLSEENSII